MLLLSLFFVTWLSWRANVLGKLSFQNVFHHTKRKASIFKFLRFVKRLRKAPFLLRNSLDGRPYRRLNLALFQIPPAQCVPSSETQGQLVGARGNKSGKEMKRRMFTSKALTYDASFLCPIYFLSPQLTAPGSPRMSVFGARWFICNFIMTSLPSHTMMYPDITNFVPRAFYMAWQGKGPGNEIGI